MSDFLIRNARVVDGTGAPVFTADVRIEDGRITAIGDSLPDADIVVDAAGRYLAPGFIDAHCHDDLICLREPDRIEKIMQGVTCLVVGNCSFSLYPTVPGSVDHLRQHFSTLLGEIGADEVFDGFAGYRDALHRQGISLNVISLVGHAALRLAVLGYDPRPATAEERATMQRLLDRQLADGAFGLTLGLVYPPSAYSDAEELQALARTTGARGKILAAHVRSYEGQLIESIDEFLGLLETSKAPGLLSHLQAAGKPNWGKIPKAIAQLEAANARGVDVSFDMYPYLAGSSYMLQLVPQSMHAGGVHALIAALKTPQGLAELRRSIEDPDAPWISKVAMIGWGNVRISGTSNPALKKFEGRDMQAAADSEGMSPFDFMVRMILEDEGQTTIVMFQLDKDDLHAACTHELHMVGSDGLPRPGTKPHPRAFGTFPRVAGHLRRDEHWFSLEDAVRRMTSVAARRFGLKDRGVIAPGMVADMVLFDENITDRATFDDPSQLPSGIETVWVAGQAVVDKGKPTGARPGRVLTN
ncbi:MAG: D-aminoacylase [Alphaproteobacteria bacterium]